MSGEFFHILREVVLSYYNNGTISSTPVGYLATKRVDANIHIFLSRFVKLLMEGVLLCEETKIYISNANMSYTKIVYYLKKNRGKLVNVNTTQTKVWNDKVKLVKLFGDRFLIELVVYNNVEKLRDYNKILEEIEIKYGLHTISNKLNLKLRKVHEVFMDIEEEKRSSTREKFDEFISIIGPYTKRHMQYMSDIIEKEYIMYFNYLLTEMNLSDSDLENKKKLLNLLL